MALGKEEREMIEVMFDLEKSIFFFLHFLKVYALENVKRFVWIRKIQQSYRCKYEYLLYNENSKKYFILQHYYLHLYYCYFIMFCFRVEKLHIKMFFL